ncbi:MAG TPA: bifunctional metallophosphatase/5'-nucleotidase [Candidatus Agrococcus pullicola]|uniref:Bifunctional metallophosphatase/5'-nucleotidase n=1 Tax=Candidatus Agrococcus pullicola TaxID=2838429 RepID=A0A9D1Z072_9MICO|nr:bifunctional metallophosphatase/5'-nucleotidase [Candidatus Agrococcus pullicola]
MTTLRRRGKVYAVTAAALAAALAIPGAAAAQAQEDETRVNVLYFNDFHGRIDNYADLTVGFAATIEELRQVEGEENTLVLSGGDSVGGTLYNSSSQNDQPTIDVLNALEIDASALGNHEFDAGIADLEERITPGTDFSYLGANVTYNGNPVADGGVEMFEVGDITVAVIGAVTEETPGLVDQNGIQGVEFTNAVDAVNREAAELEASGEADIVVAVFHAGGTVQLSPNAPQEEQATALEAAMQDQREFREIVEDTDPSVDLILNGHTHKPYNWLAPVAGGGERPIVQAGEYASHIGQIPLVIDADGNVEVDLDGFGLVSTADTEIPVDNERVNAVSDIVDDAVRVADELGSVPIGSLEEGADITTAYIGDQRDDRGSASTMGTLVANMYRDALESEQRGGAEIGIVNPGGLRSDFVYSETVDGVLTVRDAVDVLPFANSLFTTTLTGAQLKQTLEEQWQPDGADRGYLQLGLSDNVRYSSDSSQPRNERITGIWIDGERVTDEQEIRVAIPSFLTSGVGDNFFTLGDGTDTRDGGIIDSDGFMDYVEANSPLSPDFARSQLDIVGLPTDAVDAGSQVEFTVNDVDLTSLGTPQSESLYVYYGDEQIAEAPVADNSAEVSFTVPGGEGDAEAAGSDGSLATVTFFEWLFQQDAVPTTEEFSLRTDSGTNIPFELQVVPADDDVTPTEDPSESPSESDPGDSDGDTGGDGNLPETSAELPYALLGFALLAMIAGGAVQLRRRS